MLGTPTIRIANPCKLLYEGDLSTSNDKLNTLIKRLEIDEKHMLSVYLKEQGTFLFMAVLTISKNNVAKTHLAFHQGVPKHICQTDKLVKHLLHLTNLHIKRREQECKFKHDC
jgi:hypothetical protein